MNRRSTRVQYQNGPLRDFPRTWEDCTRRRIVSAPQLHPGLRGRVNELCGGCRLAKPSPGGRRGLGTSRPLFAGPGRAALTVGGGARSPAGSEQWPVRPDSSPGRLRGPCSCTGPFPRAPGSGQRPEPACTARGAEPGTRRLRARGRLLRSRGCSRSSEARAPLRSRTYPGRYFECPECIAHRHLLPAPRPWSLGWVCSQGSWFRR